MKRIVTLLLAISFVVSGQLPAPTFPTLKTSVPVEYTAAARAAGLQGSIYLYVQVEPDGSTSHVQVLHGLGLGLDEKAVEAVKQWHYSPAMAGGKPVSMGHSAEVEFRLERNSEWRILMTSYTMPGYGPVRGDEPKLVQYKAFQFGDCQAGATGWVEFNIRSDGTPDWVTTDSGSAFREAAAKAIADWRYKPGRQDGRDGELARWSSLSVGLDRWTNSVRRSGRPQRGRVSRFAPTRGIRQRLGMRGLMERCVFP